MPDSLTMLLLLSGAAFLLPRTIAAAGGIYLAIRRDDPDLAETVVKHVFRSKEPTSPVKDMLALLPKGKPDE